jgi:hypothetical protein
VDNKNNNVGQAMVDQEGMTVCGQEELFSAWTRWSRTKLGVVLNNVTSNMEGYSLRWIVLTICGKEWIVVCWQKANKRDYVTSNVVKAGYSRNRVARHVEKVYGYNNVVEGVTMMTGYSSAKLDQGLARSSGKLCGTAGRFLMDLSRGESLSLVNFFGGWGFGKGCCGKEKVHRTRQQLCIQ